MLRRPLFSIFPHSYTCGGMIGSLGVSVWASVRYVICLLRALLIFALIDMRFEFSSYAFMTDACLSGYGVGGGYIGTSGIQNMFVYHERWRFKEHAEDGETHRERALRQKHDNAKSLAVVAAADPLSDSIAASAVSLFRCRHRSAPSRTAGSRRSSAAPSRTGRRRPPGSAAAATAAATGR